MSSWTLWFNHLDGNTGIPSLAIDGDTPADLAQAVHRHARGRLGSRRVDITFDDNTYTGTVRRHGLLVGEFTLVGDEEEQPPDTADELPPLDELRHGFTLRDVEQMTCTAVKINLWYRGIDIDERHDEARFAIVQHLYTTDTAPHWGELVWIGAHAADKLTYSSGVSHGVRGGSTSQGRGPMPSFHTYWYTAAGTTPSCENRIIDRTALWQIFGTLSPRDRENLLALAAHGTYQEAAAAVGRAGLSYTAQISKARAAFRALWHEHETPSAMWGTDRRRNQHGVALDGRRSRSAKATIRARSTGRSVRAGATS